MGELLELLPLWYLMTVAGLLGLAVGSFLNVVIHRVPRGESIIKPGSHCPSCETPIAWWDNLPLLSWLFLRGRCRHCGSAISARYLVIELLGAAVAMLALLRYGVSWPALATMLLGWHLLALSVIDLKHLIVPDHIVLPMGLLGLLLAVAGGGWPGLKLALLSGAIAGGFFLLMHLVARLALGREGMGGGDVTLAIGMAVYLHPIQLPFAVLTGSVLALVVALSWSVMTRQTLRDRPLPFVPPLALGGWLLMLLGMEGLGLVMGSIMDLMGLV